MADGGTTFYYMLASIAINAAIAYATAPDFSNTGPKLDDNNVVGSRYGAGIPKVHGRMRASGNIIWALPLREEVHEERQSAGKGSSVTTTTYSYYGTYAALLCEGAEDLRPLRVWMDKKLMWEAPSTEAHLAGNFAGGGSFEFMPGSEGQTRSSAMSAALGLPSTPAYRGRCVMVVADLPVDAFGRRIPTIEVEVARGAADAAAVLSDVLLDLFTASGLAEFQIDLSEVDAEAWGTRVPPSTAAAVLDSMLAGAGLQVVCTGTKLAVRPLVQPIACEIDEGDLLAGEQRFPIRRLREDVLPRSVQVNYLDPQRDYQVGAQEDSRQVTSSVHTLAIDVPMAVQASQMRSAANTLLYRAWTARTQYGPFGLPPKYLMLEPGDVAGITVDGRRHLVRLTQITIGANGALQCEGEAYDASVMVGVGGGDSGEFPGQTLPEFGSTALWFYNAPALIDAETSVAGFRFAAAGTGRDWRSGVLERSVDGGASWTAIAAIGSYSVCGYVADPLPAPPEDVGGARFDEVTAIELDLIKGALQSVTLPQLLAGANLMLLGREVIQYRDAEHLGGTSYRLTGLLRGRKGTEWAMGMHEPNELAALMNTAPFVAASAADIGQQWMYRVTPGGGDPSGPAEHIIDGQSARPYTPAHIAGARDESGNLTVQWVRRSRVGTELPNSGDIAIDEPTLRYEVEVMNGLEIKRRIATTTEQCAYTAAQQVEDFGGPQPAVDVRVYQLGALVSRSMPGRATV